MYVAFFAFNWNIWPILYLRKQIMRCNYIIFLNGKVLGLSIYWWQMNFQFDSRANEGWKWTGDSWIHRPKSQKAAPKHPYWYTLPQLWTWRLKNFCKEIDLNVSFRKICNFILNTVSDGRSIISPGKLFQYLISSVLKCCILFWSWIY